MARMGADISYLASDDLEGRLTGTKGEKLSAEYIAGQFAAKRLQPMGDSGTWMQKFSIVRLRLPSEKSSFWFDLILDTFRLHTDFYLLSQSANDAEARGEIFNAGYGIAADSLNWNDYRDKGDLKGKIFVIRHGHPEPNNPHSRFEPYSSVSAKVNTAIRLGAAGVVFYNTDTLLENPSGNLKRNENVSGIPVFFVKSQVPMLLASKTAYLNAKVTVRSGTGHNVIGYRDNHAPYTVVIGAHHDHLGYGELGGSRSTENSQIHNGADDNASGVAAMLELMRTLKGRKYKKYNYLFMAYSGEELGLLGSKYFVAHPTVETSKISYMVNIDMLGRLDSQSHVLVINGAGTSPLWKESIAAVKRDSNQLRITTSESGVGASDHTSFYLQNIPVLHFFTGQHRDYHMPSDDEWKINYTGLYLSEQYIASLIRSTQKKGKLAFSKTKDIEPGRTQFKVTMGIMPDYTFSGPGVRIDGASAGKPAASIGMEKGDVILKMGDYTINSMEDYMSSLKNFSKGQTIQVTYRRGTEEITKDVTF